MYIFVKTIKIMKRILLSLAVASIALFNSCTDDILDIKFNVNMVKVTFILPSQTAAGTFDLDPTSVDLNLDSIAKANNVSLDKIKSAKVHSATIKILSPSDMTFNPLSSASLSVKAPGSGLATGRRMCSVSSVPRDVKELTLETSGEDLLPLIRNPFEVWATLTTTEPIAQASTLEATVVFEIVANPTK